MQIVWVCLDQNKLVWLGKTEKCNLETSTGVTFSPLTQHNIYEHNTERTNKSSQG